MAEDAMIGARYPLVYRVGSLDNPLASPNEASYPSRRLPKADYSGLKFVGSVRQFLLCNCNHDECSFLWFFGLKESVLRLSCGRAFEGQQ